MERQVNQMVRLVDDLLEISRITRGQIELRKERVDLAAVIQSAVEVSKTLIEEFDHHLAISLPAEPLTVEADPVRLEQIISNLLNNAAKYTDPGGRIWLSAQCESENVAISVRDSGVGILPDMLPRVFEMFTQLEHSASRTQGGLGIGLTLVRSLVEMHGGRSRLVAKVQARAASLLFVYRLMLASGAGMARDLCGAPGGYLQGAC